jgi:hypothetical protein
MRKTATVTIDEDGRDKGKSFRLTEMSAMKTEKWATRALLALANGGVDIPDGLERSGLAGLAVVGIQLLGKLDYDVAAPLLDEMMSCVEIKTDARIRSLTPDDIEEVSTLLFLRAEVFKLHASFFPAVARLISTMAPATES